MGKDIQAHRSRGHCNIVFFNSLPLSTKGKFEI